MENCRYDLRRRFVGNFRSAEYIRYEDYRRYQQDLYVNGKSCYVLALTSRELADGTTQRRLPVLREIRWKDIMVGHIVYLHGDTPVPADMVVISTSDAENGLCYVETSQLDGESNLKIKVDILCSAIVLICSINIQDHNNSLVVLFLFIYY